MDGPVLTKGRTNLDTLTWKTGRLVIAVAPEGPILFGELSGRAEAALGFGVACIIQVDAAEKDTKASRLMVWRALVGAWRFSYFLAICQ